LCISFCMADMLASALPTRPAKRICEWSLRRAPYPPPSDPVSRHRTGIVSSSLDQGSPAERTPPPCSLPHFGFGISLFIGPVFGQGLFFARRNQACGVAFSKFRQLVAVHNAWQSC
jgi:hypothetical protein